MLALTPATLGGAHDLLARALVFVVLTAGGLAALASLLTRKQPVGPGGPVADPRFVHPALGGAFAGALAGSLAVALGGPGALPWLVLACLAGAAIQHAEARLLVRLYPRVGQTSLASRTGPAEQVLALGHALTATIAALAAGALLHAHQAAEAVRAAGPISGWAVGLGLAALAAVALVRPGRWLGPLALVALAVHVALMIVLLAGGAVGPVFSTMFSQALGGEAALAGAVAAAAQGIVRASVAGATGGLGHAAAPPQRAWAAPLVTAAVALLTGLAALSGPTPGQAIAGRELVPLEPHLRGGLAPSTYGQLIVVPPDSGLEEGKKYPMVLRADPRGHRYGEIIRDDNIVAAPAWDFTRTVDTIILRDKDPVRGENPGFDIRIPARRELVETKLGPFLKLHPIDPTIKLSQLVASRDLVGPFLNVDDFHFVGGVARGFQLSGGDRLTMFEEPRPPDAPRNPALRDFIAFNYTGPFFDRGAPPAPVALPVPLESGLEVGSLIDLRLDAPTRGLELGFINRHDELEVPPWDFLAACDTAILRHKDDPTLDRTIAVRSRLTAGRLRFQSPDINLAELKTLLPEYTGPHLRPPSYEFTAEVHRGARLPAGQADTHLALVAVHDDRVPTGNPGTGIYHPHPGEVLLTGMQGPVLAQDASGTLVRGLARRLGPAGAGLGAAALVLLALAGLVQWLRAGLRSASLLLGPVPGIGVGLLFLACVALGPCLGLPPLLRMADAAAALAVLLGLARLLALLVWLGRPERS
jgi:Na+/alanine symporter